LTRYETVYFPRISLIPNFPEDEAKKREIEREKMREKKYSP
jgi:hypothetical protein